jgi:hypothetical protein
MPLIDTCWFSLPSDSFSNWDPIIFFSLGSVENATGGYCSTRASSDDGVTIIAAGGYELFIDVVHLLRRGICHAKESHCGWLTNGDVRKKGKRTFALMKSVDAPQIEGEGEKYSVES